MNYWLVKSEPEAYSFADLLGDGKTDWTGVRNYQARNHLRAMKKGDVVFVYHSVSEKALVGIAQVSKEAFPDKTAEEGDWSCVELKPLRAFKTPLTLESIKAHPTLKEIPLIRQSRLSVMPLEAKAVKSIFALAQEKPL
jgi:predicted RNA-binding protein with PUA-like domain